MRNAAQIRPATAADIPAIARIYAEQVLNGAATFEIDPPDEAEMQKRFETVTGGGYPYLVAADGGSLLGYAYAGLYRPRPAYRFTVEDSIYLAPEARGKGIGTMLLNAVVSEAEARGFRQMIAVIGDTANEASIRLHARAGFRNVGTFAAVGWKFDRWLDSVLMQRSLGPGSTSPP